jgi:hypothetical protein
MVDHRYKSKRLHLRQNERCAVVLIPY